MTTLDTFARALRMHDWTYNYSDDPRAYRAGLAERDAITRMMQDLKASGLGEEARALYDAAAPEVAK